MKPFIQDHEDPQSAGFEVLGVHKASEFDLALFIGYTTSGEGTLLQNFLERFGME